ncbi:hypothetical protein WN943_025244 [Citrus x changshan-huyou]
MLDILMAIYPVLSILTSVINHYQVYVSTVQAYNYHVTAFQWHPEVLTSMLLTMILAHPIYKIDKFNMAD